MTRYRSRTSVHGSKRSLKWIGSVTFVLLLLMPGMRLAATATPSAAAADDGGRSDGVGVPATHLVQFYQRYISDLRYGRCRFEPSCSQYAIESIGEHGFIKGGSLAADRLIRCNGHAANFHVATSSGRLSDPVDHSGISRHAPRVPEWLLPRVNDRPLPVSSHASDIPDSLASGTSRIVEDAAFADALAASGDCERAVTEYKRVAFVAGTDEVVRWSFVKIGDCCFANEEWRNSASAYTEAARQLTTPSEKNIAYYMAATSYFNTGEYEQTIACLTRCVPESRQATDPAVQETDVTGDLHSATPDRSAGDELEHANVLFLTGLSTLALGDWSESAASFAKAADACADSLCRDRALFLARRAEECARLPSKHPKIAAGLSTVLPGSGQVYAGRAYDGFRHFVFDGLLIFTIYQLADDDLWGAAYLVAGITLPFYVGNILGAKRSAQHYNASKRAEFVSESLKRTSTGTTCARFSPKASATSVGSH